MAPPTEGELDVVPGRRPRIGGPSVRGVLEKRAAILVRRAVGGEATERPHVGDVELGRGGEGELRLVGHVGSSLYGSRFAPSEGVRSRPSKLSTSWNTSDSPISPKSSSTSP